MKREIIRSSSADRDVAAILNYYLDEHAEDAGNRFLQELEKTLEIISALPDLGHPYESSDVLNEELRCWPVRAFENYLVFYRVTVHGVLIKRVLHGSRDLPSLLGGSIRPS